jgi:hypothetical protein
MAKKTKRDRRPRGMSPGRKYYVIAAGRPQEIGEETVNHVHYVTTKEGTNIMFVFSTPKKARRFIRKSLEGDPQAYLDLLENGRGELPDGLQEGIYTVIERTPEELTEMGVRMGVQGIVLDPGPGVNRPVPLRGATPGLDPEGDYYVLLAGPSPMAAGFFHYVNHRNEVVLPVFTSPQRALKFAKEHSRANTGYLNDLRKGGVIDLLRPKRPVVYELAALRMRLGKLKPIAETLAVIVSGLNAGYVVIDPGEPDCRYMQLPAQAA